MQDLHPIQAPAVLIYSVSGVGKSTTSIRALTPEKTDWISCERGALKPASNPELNPWHPKRPRETLCLHVSRKKGDAQVFREFENAVEAACKRVERGDTYNIVIDTLSAYARRLNYYVSSVCGIQPAYGAAARAIGEHLMPYLDRVYEMCTTARRPNGVWGATLVCLCHEKDPFQAAADKRTGEPAKRIPGGPDLPGALMKKVRHDFDLVLRAEVQPGGRRVFVHDSSNRDLPTKDRWGIVPDRASGQTGVMPLDLGAILRVGAALDANRTPAEKDLAILHACEGEAVGGARPAADMVDL